VKYVPISAESVKSVFYFDIPWRTVSGVFRSRIRESANLLSSLTRGFTESVDQKKKRLPACQHAGHDAMAIFYRIARG
jgi:hypothetical protein